MANRTCTVDSCDRPHDSRGFCKKHARQLREKLGIYAPPSRPRATPGLGLRERLENIGWDVTSTGCWEWRGARSRGYGSLGVGGGATRRAHRVSAQVFLLGGHEIPPGLVVMHACDNPPCINPEHLAIGAQRENIRDMIRKGRQNFVGLPAGRTGRVPSPRAATRRPRTEALISEAQRLRSMGYASREIADALGVSRSHASRLSRGLSSGN